MKYKNENTKKKKIKNKYFRSFEVTYSKKLIENFKKYKYFKIIFLELNNYHVYSYSIRGNYKIYYKFK
jgi:hypothetical protein